MFCCNQCLFFNLVNLKCNSALLSSLCLFPGVCTFYFVSVTGFIFSVVKVEKESFVKIKVLYSLSLSSGGACWPCAFLLVRFAWSCGWCLLGCYCLSLGGC